MYCTPSRVTINLIFVFSIYTLGTNAEFNETDFWLKRTSLIEEEKSLAIGGNTLFYSTNEIEANNLLMKYKRSEIDKAFFNSSKFLPSHNFMTVKENIDQSEVFKVIKKMPKGALLNVHASALVSADWIYQNVTFRNDVYICILPEKILLRIFKEPSNDCNWQLLSELRASNETVSEQINSRIQKELTLATEDLDEAYPDIKSLWGKFKKIFDIRVPLLRYKPLFEDYVYQGLEELYEDNVMFLEVRTPLLEMYDFDGVTYDEEESMKVYADVASRFIRDHPDFIGVKIIYSLYRKMEASQLIKHVDKAIKLKEKYPDLLAGFDLIGQEDNGNPLKHWISVLAPLVDKVNLYFHAGETNWYGIETDENLFDAIILNVTRIGHGYAIAKHPEIVELMKLKNIPVEICPIANQVLKLVNDLRNHPASVLFAQNFPAIVSSNNPGVWGSSPLSHDFYEAFMGLMSKHADIRALRQLAINSIEYSSLNDDEKVRAHNIWLRKWNEFVDNLIAEA